MNGFGMAVSETLVEEVIDLVIKDVIKERVPKIDATSHAVKLADWEFLGLRVDCSDMNLFWEEVQNLFSWFPTRVLVGAGVLGDSQLYVQNRHYGPDWIVVHDGSICGAQLRGADEVIEYGVDKYGMWVDSQHHYLANETKIDWPTKIDPTALVDAWQSSQYDPTGNYPQWHSHAPIAIQMTK